MYKRLTISLVLMGLAAFSLAAGAVAWFSDDGDADVSITAGTPDLKFSVDQSCDGSEDLSGNLNGSQTLQWSNIVPGEETEDCIVVSNDGDGTLDVYVDHQGPFTGALLNHIDFRYWTYVGGNPQDNLTNRCGATSAQANAAAFTSDNDGRGCFLGTLEETQSLQFKGRALFNDSGSGQNGLTNTSLGFTIVVTGYTG